MNGAIGEEWVILLAGGLMGAVRSGQEIQTSMRAQTAGVALPRIVMPGGRQ